MNSLRLLLALGALLLLPGCVTYSRAPWRAGASRSNYVTPLEAAGDPDQVALYRKLELSALEQTQGRRIVACGTTTLLRKAYLLAPEQLEAVPPGAAWEAVADLTTEEYPRDEASSELRGDSIFNVFGIGSDPWDLFDVRLDPAFLPDALARLRELAAGLGADAVVDVYATGGAEHHMWHGFRLGLDPQETSSPVFSHLRLLGFQLRDVRLHGTAVRRAD